MVIKMLHKRMRPDSIHKKDEKYLDVMLKVFK